LSAIAHSFPEQSARVSVTAPVQQWLRNALGTSRTWIVVDGLDELTNRDRDSFSAANLSS
jgi:hypothetical protein